MLAAGQRRLQVMAAAGEQAGVQVAVGGHPGAVAVAAERGADRADEAQLATAGEDSIVVRTVVEFAPLSEAEIAWYVASGEPLGKAGAYGIQGLASRFVTRVDGSYPNVVGLPVAEVAKLLAKYLQRAS